LIIGNSYTREDVTLIKGHRQLPPLNGPYKDARLMKEAFEYLKFFTMVKHNVTEDELIALLYSLANCPYPKSCQRFVLSFSGHGVDGFICSEDERRVKVSDIVEVLTPKSSNDSLVGIPRLFFFDVCQGYLCDPGIIARREDENWQSRIPSTGDVLVAYATSPGYKSFEGMNGGLWTSILAKKLVTSPNSIYDILIEVDRELISKIRKIEGSLFCAPELVGRLNTIIHLLQESGKILYESICIHST